ncbi:MAG: hypothetical protein ACREFH_14230 [Stellaceae bacterium]
MTAGDDAIDERERRMRARNRALLAVLFVLAGLFYLISIVRITTGLGP